MLLHRAISFLLGLLLVVFWRARFFMTTTYPDALLSAGRAILIVQGTDYFVLRVC
jgi:hypothetical protein